MMRQRVETWRRRLHQLITEPLGELTRWQRSLRYAYLLGAYGWRQMGRGRAPAMAAALSFRTLFGLLPVLVVGTLLVRVFKGWDEFYRGVETALRESELSSITVMSDADARSVSLSQWLLDLLAQVDTINMAAIGWVGLLVVVYSAISLMITIENSFNSIYLTARRMSWIRRLPHYWFVLCLAPAALAVMRYVDQRVENLIHSGNWDNFVSLAGWAWSVSVTWLIVFAVYKIVPHTLVATRPAAIGALVTAVLLTTGKMFLGAYVANALSIRQLYGSLGLIPLFMFWVYLMWLVVLYGLEVTATLQTVSRRELEQSRREPQVAPTGLSDPESVLGLMELVAGNFLEGRTTPIREITDELGIPESTVDRMVEPLTARGFLHRTDPDSRSVVLARAPERIPASDLIAIGFDLSDQGRKRRSRLFESLRRAQQEAASSITLATLLAG